jgi:hypothetical protein
MKKLIALTLVVVTLFSCTANERARNYGGTEHITLDKGERLVNVTWKQDDNLWVLTKQDSTKPSTYSFKEKSSFGVLEGEVIITEQ